MLWMLGDMLCFTINRLEGSVRHNGQICLLCNWCHHHQLSPSSKCVMILLLCTSLFDGDGSVDS